MTKTTQKALQFDELAQSEQASDPNLWELNGTITEYAYLTHNFFRYYGKFPSVLAKRVLQEYAPRTGVGDVLDN